MVRYLSKKSTNFYTNLRVSQTTPMCREFSMVISAPCPETNLSVSSQLVSIETTICSTTCCKICNAVLFFLFTAKCGTPVKIHCQLCSLYGEYMSIQMVCLWRRQMCIESRENVHEGKGDQQGKLQWRKQPNWALLLSLHNRHLSSTMNHLAWQYVFIVNTT